VRGGKMTFNSIIMRDYSLWLKFYPQGKCPNCLANFGQKALIDNDDGWHIKVINKQDFTEIPIKCEDCKVTTFFKFWFNENIFNKFLDSIVVEWEVTSFCAQTNKDTDQFLKQQRDDILRSVFG
jgi:hypothetical protein